MPSPNPSSSYNDAISTLGINLFFPHNYECAAGLSQVRNLPHNYKSKKCLAKYVIDQWRFTPFAFDFPESRSLRKEMLILPDRDFWLFLWWIKDRLMSTEKYVYPFTDFGFKHVVKLGAPGLKTYAAI